MIGIPQIPWILSGVITDIDGSTAVEGASISVLNMTTAERMTTTSVADGSYAVTFTSYSDDDILVLEAKKEISSTIIKYGEGSTQIDVALPGKTLDVTMDKFIDKAALDIFLRKPFQERQDLIYDPRFKAFRVVPVGFDKVQTTLTRDANGFITQMEEDDGLHVKVTVLTRDANNYITSIAERIK